MTGRVMRWTERYEEDRRKLNELYEWLGIAQDTPIARVIGATSGITLTGNRENSSPKSRPALLSYIGV